MKFNNLENMVDSLGLIDELALLYYDYMKKEKIYLDKYPLNMIEIHFLTTIYESPGILISEFARRWDRTLSSISKSVSKLEKKGYLEKRKIPGNNKNIHLYLTDIGNKLAEEHKKFDFEGHSKMLSALLKKHTEEELNSFFGVLDSVTKYLSK